MRFNLDSAANIVIIACGLFVIGTLAGHAKRPSADPVQIVKPYTPGEQLPAGIDYGLAKRNVLLFVKSTCQYCTASMPFYQTLTRKAQASSGDVRVLALSSDETDESLKYFGKHGVRLMDAVRIAPGQFRVRGTPTLIVADSFGRVVRAWAGELPSAVQADVLRSLQ